MRVEKITSTEEAVLAALATYRYLTPDQMLRLGVTRSSVHLYDTLRKLTGTTKAFPAKGSPGGAPAHGARSGAGRKPGLLVALDFGVLPGHGRLARLYALTPRAAELLTAYGRHDGPIEVPKQVSLFSEDYFHRLACVEFHIALRSWAAEAGLEVDFFHAYYDPVAGGAREGRAHPKTHVRLRQGSLVPDAIFAFSDAASKRRLCAFEMYNRRRTARVVKQLATYLSALEARAIEKAYGYEKDVRVLLGFEDAEGLELVARRALLQPGFSRAEGHGEWFFLAPLAVIKERFHDGWRRFDGTPARLF